MFSYRVLVWKRVHYFLYLLVKLKDKKLKYTIFSDIYLRVLCDAFYGICA
jgi:hypothetical protein